MSQQLAKVPVGTIAGGSRADPTYNRLSSHIHNAVGQFDAINPTMEHTNVLAFVNGDDETDFTDLIQVLTGNAYCDNGEVVPMFRAYSEGKIREEKLRVQLYLWFDAWKPGVPEKFFPEVHVLHHAALCRYFSIDSAALERLPE